MGAGPCVVWRELPFPAALILGAMEVDCLWAELDTISAPWWWAPASITPGAQGFTRHGARTLPTVRLHRPQTSPTWREEVTGLGPQSSWPGGIREHVCAALGFGSVQGHTCSGFSSPVTESPSRPVAASPGSSGLTVRCSVASGPFTSVVLLPLGQARGVLEALPLSVWLRSLLGERGGLGLHSSLGFGPPHVLSWPEQSCLKLREQSSCLYLDTKPLLV